MLMLADGLTQAEEYSGESPRHEAGKRVMGGGEQNTATSPAPDGRGAIANQSPDSTRAAGDQAGILRLARRGTHLT
jgi:hypothetical protein